MNNSNKKELTEEEIETLLLLNYLEHEGMSTISNYANRLYSVTCMFKVTNLFRLCLFQSKSYRSV